MVSPAKNLWHCLGACQTGGSVVDWTMKTQGVSFRHAVELLRADFFPLAASSSRIVKVATVPMLGSPISIEMSDRELMLRVVDYYNERLKTSPEALGYLERRGIRSEEAIDHFKLGFANRTLGLRLPAKNRKEGDELRGRLAKLGVLREETGHEHFNGSLVVPIFDAAGDVVEMYGRKITPGLRQGTPLHLYLPGPHRGVWNLDALREHKEIIARVHERGHTFVLCLLAVTSPLVARAPLPWTPWDSSSPARSIIGAPGHSEGTSAAWQEHFAPT